MSSTLSPFNWRTGEPSAFMADRQFNPNVAKARPPKLSDEGSAIGSTSRAPTSSINTSPAKSARVTKAAI